MDTDTANRAIEEIFSEDELADVVEVVVPAPPDGAFPGDAAAVAAPRMPVSHAVGVGAAVGVSGLALASVLAKEDATLSPAATPDQEKTAEEIALNIGVGDDVARVEVPEPVHTTITYEDATGGYGADLGHALSAAGIPDDFDNSCETLI